MDRGRRRGTARVGGAFLKPAIDDGGGHAPGVRYERERADESN